MSRPSQFVYDAPSGQQPSAASTEASQTPVDWAPFLLGFIPHFFCWAVIFCYFFVGVKRDNPPGERRETGGYKAAILNPLLISCCS